MTALKSRAKIAIAFAIVFMGLIMSSWSMAEPSTNLGYDYAEKPSWVTDIQPSYHEKSASDAVSYTLVDRQLNLIDDNYTLFRRVTQTINSKQGLTEASEFRVFFNPEFQNLTIHNITVTRDGVASDVTRDARIDLARQELESSFGLINGDITALINLFDIRVGDQIDFSYSIDGTNTVFGDKRFALFSSTWGVDIGASRIRVLINQNRPLIYNLHNTPGALIVSTDSGITEYVWKHNNIDAIRDEGDYPAWYIPYGYVELSEYQTWRQVSDWAATLFDPDVLLSAELKSLNDSLYSKSKSKKDYVKRVINFVQDDIRYLGLELGQNSHKPNAPELVYQRRFGDCKDKAQLIYALLKHKGITATPALVSAQQQKFIENRLASPGAFDHVINRIDVDGHEYWIDGTRTHQYGPLESMTVSSFTLALPILNGQENLVEINHRDQSDPVHNIEEIIESTDYKSPAKLTLNLEYKGAEAEDMRAYIESEGIEPFEQDILNFYRRIYPTLESSSDISVWEDDNQTSINIVANYSIPNYWDAKEKDFVVTLYGETLSSYATLPSTMERKMPLALYDNVSAKHKITVNLPEPIDWELDASPLTIQNEGLEYNRKIKYSPTSISIEHLYQTKQDHIPINSMQEYFQDLRDMRESLYYSVTISNSDYSSSSSDLRSRLRDALKKRTPN